MNNGVSKKKIALVLAFAGMAAGSAQAAQINATAKVEVLTPISVADTTSLNFGKVAGDIDATKNISVDPTDGSFLVQAGAYAFSTPTRGVLTVTGSAAATFSLTVGTSATLTGTGVPMTASITHFDPTSGTLSGVAGSGSGTATIYVGGTLTLEANQAAGIYTGTYPVTVNYQ